LAFIYAQLGNKTKAKHYIQQYEETFGEYGITDDAEKKLLANASQLTSSQVNMPLKQHIEPTIKDNYGSHTFFIESEDESEHLLDDKAEEAEE
jgi:heme oxygenase